MTALRYWNTGKWVDHDPALSEHERWLRKNGVTDVVRQL